MGSTGQLILIRQFFDQARRTLADTPFVRVQRTLHLDLCIELALNLVVLERGTSEEQSKQGGRRDLSWHDLWSLANDVALRATNGRSLPEAQQLKLLHEIRNLAQHRGSVPSSDDVRRAVEPVRALLEFVSRELLGRDFENLHEWDALEHADLRQWLNDCAQAIALGLPLVAAVGAKLAYDLIAKRVHEEAVGPDSWYYRSTVYFPKELEEPMRRLGQALTEAATTLESELVAVSLGLSVSDHYRFLRVGRRVHITRYADGHYELGSARGWPPDPDTARYDADFVVAYLGKAALLLESAYPGVLGGLQLPFRLQGTEFWNTHLERSAGVAPSATSEAPLPTRERSAGSGE